MTDLITTLQHQEQELVFEAFDHTDAWRASARASPQSLSRPPSHADRAGAKRAEHR